MRSEAAEFRAVDFELRSHAHQVNAFCSVGWRSGRRQLPKLPALEQKIEGSSGTAIANLAFGPASMTTTGL